VVPTATYQICVEPATVFLMQPRGCTTFRLTAVLDPLQVMAGAGGSVTTGGGWVTQAEAAPASATWWAPACA